VSGSWKVGPYIRGWRRQICIGDDVEEIEWVLLPDCSLVEWRMFAAVRLFQSKKTKVEEE
jgi:hypothetical protein